MEVKTESKTLLTVDMVEYDALDSLLWFIFNEVSEKKLKKNLSDESIEALQNMYHSL